MARAVDFVAAQIPTADQLDVLVDYFAHLTSPLTDIVSNTTLADVTGLSLDLPTGYTFRFECGLFAASASNTPDMDSKMAYSGSTSLYREWFEGPLAAITAVPNTITMLGTATTPTEVTSGVTSTESLTLIRGHFTTTTAGTLKVQAAQNVSNATALSIKAGSYLWARIVA
ncbi:MAG TPA: hypothetical protein VFB74_33870 [Kribbellaceae bacterium]|nr:hypothetical protein [Kribbellaceae bacterium]